MTLRKRLFASIAVTTATLVGASALAMSPLAPAPAHAQQLFDNSELDAIVEAMNLDNDGKSVITDLQRRQVAPGVDLVSVSRIDPAGRYAGGRLTFDVLVANLGSGDVRADYMYPGTVSDAETVTDLMVENDAFAAINGTFFDINNSNAPLHVGISEDEGLVTYPDTEMGLRHVPIAFTADGLARMANISMTSTVVVNGATVAMKIDGYNTPNLASGNIGLFDTKWGTYPRSGALNGATGVEIIIDADGTVLSIGEPSSTPLAEGQKALLANGSSAANVLTCAIAVGDSVDVTVDYSSATKNIVSAIGGNYRLVNNGKPLTGTSLSLAPRVGMGINQAGTIMYIVAVDGRGENSIGIALPEMGTLMHQVGSYNATNLDGGGSSTLAVTEPGDDDIDVVNTPSDGYERAVPNAIGLFVNQGSDSLYGFNMQATPAIHDSNRVFKGLHREVWARGYNEVGNSIADTAPTWNASNGGVSITEEPNSRAIITGVESGTVSITAAQDGASGTIDLEVIGELQRVSLSSRAVLLPGAGQVGTFTVTGHDAQGFSAPIDHRDIEIISELSGDFDIVPATAGTFAVTANSDEAGESVTLRVAGHEVTVALLSGMEETVIDDMETDMPWRVWGARSTIAVEHGTDYGVDGSGGVRLDYSFTGTGSRTANMAPDPRPWVYMDDAQPTEFRVMARGTSSGAKNPDMYVSYNDGTGAFRTVYGPAPSSDEWEEIVIPLPPGTVYPIQPWAVAAYEANDAYQYSGTLWIDDFRMVSPPTVLLDPEPVVTDDVIGATGSTDDAELRIAVMSDAQFVGSHPTSPQVEGARFTLREIVAENPDLLIINGDFVDEAYPDDFALATQILEEELADATFPWIYTPGNHEIMGAPIRNFVDAGYNDTSGYLDVKGTRIIWLDTSPGQLMHDIDQMALLRAQLDAAAADDSITGVLIAQHHPIDDPLPQKYSQLSNRHDAETQRMWLESFREESGKSIALLAAHVGIFHATTEDGIPYLINGNSGKGPTAAPFGSFTGWSMVGIEPSHGVGTPAETLEDWITVEVMARADSIGFGDELETNLTVGGPSETLQPWINLEGRSSLVTWPMSHAWTASEGGFIGAVFDAPAGTIAALDPTTLEVTPLLGGTISFALTVHNTTNEIAFTVAEGTINAAVPTIGGTASPGEVLTADAGAWTLADAESTVVTPSLQWFVDGQPVEGETRATYTVRSGDLGKEVTVQASADIAGYTPVTLMSEPTQPVTTAPVEPNEPDTEPDVVVDLSVVAAGGQVQVVARGFAPGETIRVELHSDATVLGTTVANDDGAAFVTVTIPASTAVGAHEIVVIGETSEFEARTPIDVTPRVVPDAPSADDKDSDLAITGTNAPIWLAAIALFAILAGGIGAAQRRLTRTE